MMTAKKHFGFLICSCSMLLSLALLINTKTVADACTATLHDALKNVIPVLLPYTVLSQIISRNLPTGNRQASLLLACTTSLMCGNPIGAIMTQRLYDDRIISSSEAALLLPMYSCASPAFCISVIGERYLHNRSFGYALWIASCLPAIIVTICLFAKKASNAKRKADGISMLDLPSAFSSTAATLGVVTVSMVFFGAICSIAEDLPIPEGGLTMISSILELGNGIMNSAKLSVPFSYSASAFAAVFCGLSVYLQISVCAPKVCKKAYFPFKIIYSAVIAIIFHQYSSFFA